MLLTSGLLLTLSVHGVVTKQISINTGVYDNGEQIIQYVRKQQPIIEIVDSSNDECDSLNPPVWCVFSVKPGGRIVAPDGKEIKDWSEVIKEFKEKHPESYGPIIKGEGGERYKLKIK